jgi:hypothetical protein
MEFSVGAIPGPRSRLLLYVLVALVALNSSTQLLSQSPPTFPPQVVRRSVTWSDGGLLWILDVALSSPMPWYVGGLANVSVTVTLGVAPPGRSLSLVLRLVGPGGTELASKFLGTLSGESQRVYGDLQLVVSPLYFSTRAGEISRVNLTVVLEGYSDSRKYNATADFPVLISSPRSRLSISVGINGRPDYNYMVESIARVNISVLLRNTAESYVDGALLMIYVNNTLADRISIGRVGPLETREVTTTLLNYFRPGVYYIRAVASYYLQEGVVEEASAIGLLEVITGSSVVLNVDRSVAVEGTQLTFSGVVSPAPRGGQVVLEKLVDGLWVGIGTATVDPGGFFRFRWVAEDVPPDLDYVVHTFRVRVPVSLVGGVASLYSPTVSVQVFSSRMVVRFIADISLSIVPDTVARGLKASFYVRLRPQLPVCIPIKLVYRVPGLYEWAELGEVVVCGGEGVGEVAIELPPGRYPVKALVYSKSGSVESLPRVLTVVATPRLVLEAKSPLFYGESLEVRVVLSPVPDGVVHGWLGVTINGSRWFSSNISIVGGYATVSLGRVNAVGVLNITACASAYGTTVCNATLVKVLRPSISISPPSVTAETGASVSFTVAVSPGQTYPLRVSVLQDSTVVNSYSVETDGTGVARLTVSAPPRAGRYSVTVEIPGTGLSASATLNVIEVVRSISLEILNKSVPPSATVVARVTLHPPPASPVQVILLIQANGRWSPLAYGLIPSGGEGVVRFQAPADAGTYSVKARVEAMQVESNVVTLQVSPQTVIAQEYLYTLVAAAAAVGGVLLLIGRRR